MNFKEACKKAKVTEDTARKMIAIDHEFKTLYTDKERSKLVCVEFDPLPKHIEKQLLKISKTLKVSWDATLSAIIMNYLEKNG